jgi:hypothetical protein
MIRLTLLVLMAVAGLGVVGPAKSGYETGNDLFAACTGTDSSSGAGYFLCYGYISGIVDYSYYVNVGSNQFCVPAGVTKGQLKDTLIAFLRRNPKDRHLSASVIVVAALREAYPC